MSFAGTARTWPLASIAIALDTGQGALCRPEAPKAQHGPGPALDAAVILLDQVIVPTASAMPDEAPQLAIPLHLAQRAGVALQTVGHDLPRVAGIVSAERLAQEALGRLLVPLGAEPEVDGLAGAVDRPVEIAPLTADPDVGLVDVPGPAAGPEMAA